MGRASAAAVVLLVACLWPGPGGAGAADPEEVSLVRIISAPDEWDGRFVRVFGYFVTDFEGTAIYLHAEDYENSLYTNGLWVELEPLRGLVPSDCYVLMEGFFEADEHGHMGLWSGAITGVTRVMAWGATE
jgi:hypothetical protein